MVIIELLSNLTAAVTPTQPICSDPTHGSVTVGLTGDFKGNTTDLEYAIVAGNSFSGTPTFTAFNVDPLTVNNITAGDNTLRIRLKNSPLFFADFTFTLNQYIPGIHISDANFAAAIRRQSNCPSCIDACDNLTPAAKTFNSTMDVSLSGITDLTGIEGFEALTVFYCIKSPLTSLPDKLPPLLTTLVVRNNQLTSLPTNLPTGLTGFYCQGNLLTSLPTLPTGLTELACTQNSITCLPILPQTLTSLWIDDNKITCLPNTIPGIVVHNQNAIVITTPPTCPTLTTPVVSITQPNCITATGTITITEPLGTGITYSLDNGASQTSTSFSGVAAGQHSVTASAACSSSTTLNNITVTPYVAGIHIPDANFAKKLHASYPAVIDNCDNLLPAATSLKILEIGFSSISDLSGIEGFTGLTYLDCSFNSLSSLPVLPNSLTTLYCFNNQFTSLPALPNSLTILACQNNQLTSLTALPNSLTTLVCFGNNITCLPILPNSLKYLRIDADKVTCLPNQVSGLSVSDLSSAVLIPSPPICPSLVTPVVNITQPDCQTATGTITVTAPIGTGITYILDNGASQTSTSFSGVAAGQHSITASAICATSTTLNNITVTAYVAGIHIPDALFASTIKAQCPTCIDACNNLLPPAATQPTLIIRKTGIKDLSGIEGFTSLTNLDFSNTLITTLPPLPTSITTLSCSSSSTLTTITSLHEGLTSINISGKFTSLPSLPSTLTSLSCTNGVLASLPALPDGITYLDLVGNNLTSLPSPLPSKLTYLRCLHNSITALPALPDGLLTLDCGTNQLTSLPDLPQKLNFLVCWVNNIKCLPILPASLVTLEMDNNKILCLPNTVPGLIVYDVANGAMIATPPTCATFATPNVNITQPDCKTATGTITVTTPIGTGITYILDNGASQTSTSFSGVAAGQHSVTASSTCVVSTPADVTVNAQPSPPQQPSVSYSAITCGVTSGTITVTNPTSGVSFSFDGGTNFQSSATSNSFTTGSAHQVVVKDNMSSCVSTATPAKINAVLNVPGAPTVNVTQPVCGATTGTITVTNPTSGVSFSFDNGVNFSSNATSTALGANATYQVVVKDNTSSCLSTATPATINAVLNVPSAPTVSITQPVCGATTGTITVTNPTSGVSFSFDNGVNFSSNATSIALAANATYQVVVKDNTSLCLSTATPAKINAVLNVPGAPTVNVTQPVCGATTGTITVTNPTSGVSFSFDNGVNFSSNATSTALGANATYQVVVKDNTSSCLSTATPATINAVLNVPSAPAVNVTQPVCGATTGTITVTNPTSGVSFSFDNGVNFSSNATSIALAANATYQVVVKDNTSLCLSTATPAKINAVLNVPNAPTFTITQPTCATPTGTITINTPSSGVTYDFGDGNGFRQSNIQSGLGTGTYALFVKDVNSGCTSAQKTATISAPNVAAPTFSALPSPTTINCPATPSFTTPTAQDFYGIALMPNFSDKTTAGNCAGNYSVTRTWSATDGCGKTSMTSQTITVQDISKPVIAPLPAESTINCPASPVFTQATAKDVCGSANLIFKDVTTLGNSPNAYTITRTWTATDGCQNSATATQIIHVKDMDQPYISTDGGLLIASAGASYQWYFGNTPLSGETNQTFFPTTFGDYKVKVTNSLGCSRFSEAVHSDVDFVDNCPQIHKNFGQACDDGNPNTINDRVRNDCKCRGDYYSSAISVKCPTNITVVSTSKYGTIINWDEYGMFTQNTSLCSIQPNDISVQQTSGYYSGYPFPVNTLVYEEYIATDACGNKSSCSFYVRTMPVSVPNISVSPTADNLKTFTGVNLFPNPAINEVWIDLKAYADAATEILMTDISGKTMRQILISEESASLLKLDLSDIPPGLYFVKIQTQGKGDVVRKLQVSK